MKNTNHCPVGARTSCEILIVGAGQAGARVAQHLREAGYDGCILMVGAEPHLPYERPPLSKEFLAGACNEHALMLQDEAYWAERNVQLRLGQQVDHLDRINRLATLSDGLQISYERLVVATGGAPRRLSLQGDAAAHIRMLRTLADAKHLRTCFTRARRIAIIGAGVIGLEVASTARRAGLDVQVFEAGTRVMGRILCPSSSEWLAVLHREAGVTLHLGAHVERADRTQSGVLLRGVHADGTPIECEADVVVAAIGIDVEQSFLTAAGLGDARGISVDAFCRSRVDERCYAVGDVAWTPNAYMGSAFRQETWRNAENQAQAVAQFIMGVRTEPYEELPWMWTDQHGRNIQVIGVPVGITQTVTRGEPGVGAFSLYWLRDGVPRGGVLVDSGRDRRFVEQLVRARKVVPTDRLADPTVSLKSLL